MNQISDKKDCRGCMSFCMQGKQLAVAGHDESHSGWKKWKDLTSGKDGTIICSKDGLSATNQTDLINFIRDVYKTGVYNPEKGNMFDEVPKNLSHVYDSPSSKSVPGSLKVAEEGVSSDAVIYAKHYNNFLEALASSQTNPISVDSKGEPLKDKNKNPINNNATESGPVAGWWTNADPIVVSGQKYPNSDLSLIKADLYKSLYEKASKLMYHPHQCCICNVYEGGDWLEIVKDIGTACYDYGIVYNNNAGGAVDTAKGYHVTLSRFDCSGYVGACLAVFNAVENDSSSTNISGYGGTSDAYLEDGSGIPSSLKKYFSFSSSLPSKPGSILVRWAKSGVDPFGNRTEHVEIRGENGIWSGGGRGGPSGNLMMGKMDTGGTTCNFGWEYTGG